MENDCNVCHAIWLSLASTEKVDMVDLGSFEKALSSPCSIHTPLVRRFKDACQQQAEDDMDGNVKDFYDVGIVPRSKDKSASMYPSLSNLGLVWNLLLVNRASVPDHPGTGRVLDQDWVDIDILPRWKHECLTAHGTKCANPLKIWPIRPAWLIDVERNCLVPGQKCDGAYVALSYRYGDHPSFTFDAATLARLQEANALDMPQMSPYISPMIRHAMYVTSVLGERYLWADSLCIVHYDHKSATSQLELMGAIYGNAVLTIIAADTDSEEGLPGLKGASGSRKMEQKVIPFGKEQLIVRNTSEFSMISGTPYYDRGWTYQEYTNSGRKLLFNQNELHWECSCSNWHEETTFGVEVDMYINPRIHTIPAGFPDMGSMNDTVTEYNQRQLRYDEDALPAISGFLSIASRSFTGGFLYGLPEMFFDRALGWGPLWRHTNLRRRTPSQRSIESKLTPSQLPSWSWIGWQGLLTAGYGEAIRINNRLNYIQETFPVTEWYTASSPTATATERRHINSTWFANRKSYKDLNKPLPPGWTRHDASTQVTFRGDPLLYPGGCGEFVFKHEAMADPDEETNSWYYPFPVADISESTPPVLPEQTAYLFCNTQRARLWASKAIGNYPTRGGNILQLLNAEKVQVGVLHCHNELQLTGFPEVAKGAEHHDEVPPGKQVELVAIYRYKTYEKVWNEKKQENDIAKPRERITVLWVEWVDGVAYRLASGNVEKEAWNMLPLENISLVMG
ncbi:heterokaryon incompatibility protein-domain-containing protein [Annulohypoxylon bovei var. microspora]|nr:heterokaryon incompatibility protein-domain-containing protein [Annulohypoxylon bovei var. microspora]